MPNQKLIKYIQEALKQGFSKEQIKGALIKEGWQENEIEEALKNKETQRMTPSSISQIPKKKKSFFKIILLIILALILSFAGWFGFNLYQGYKIDKEMQKYSLPISDEVRKLIPPSEEEIVDWKTVFNENLGIEVKYPSFLRSKALASSIIIYPEKDVSEKISIMIGDFGTGEKALKNFEEIINTVRTFVFTGQNFISSEWIEIAGEKALTIKTQDKILGGERISIFFFDENKKLFSAELSKSLWANDKNLKGLSLDKKDVQIYEKILSALNFKKDETISWKIYKNEELGFEMKYPADILYISEACSNIVQFAYEKQFFHPCTIPGYGEANILISKIPFSTYPYSINAVSFKDNITTIQNGFTNPEIKQINFAGIEAVEISGFKKPSKGEILPAGTKLIYVIFKKRNGIYNLVYRQFPGQKDISDIYKKMLSTLKIIEAEVKSTKEQVYKDKKYEFEITMPSLMTAEHGFRVVNCILPSFLRKAFPDSKECLVFQKKFLLPDLLSADPKKYEEVYYDVYYILIYPHTYCKKYSAFCSETEREFFPFLEKYLGYDENYFFLGLEARWENILPIRSKGEPCLKETTCHYLETEPWIYEEFLKKSQIIAKIFSEHTSKVFSSFKFLKESGKIGPPE